MRITCSARTNEAGEDIHGYQSVIHVDKLSTVQHVNFDPVTNRLKQRVYNNVMGPRDTRPPCIWDSLLTMFSIHLSGKP